GAAYHWQRARQLAVPRLEGVTARTAVAELKPVIAAFDDMDHPARRHRVGIVVHREHAAKQVDANAERVPETRRHPAQTLAAGRTPEDVAALAAPGESGAVGADQLVIGAEVLTHPEIEIAFGVEGQARQAVVRIIPLGVEEDDAADLVGLAVAS